MVLEVMAKTGEHMILLLPVQTEEEMVAKALVVMAIIILVVYIIIKEHLVDQES